MHVAVDHIMIASIVSAQPSNNNYSAVACGNWKPSLSASYVCHYNYSIIYTLLWTYLTFRIHIHK
uniref:Uncharacterized protein n=1 Tax=Oryza brachyantha TaxID=4533 RepID=J3MEC4_ORYBR